MSEQDDLALLRRLYTAFGIGDTEELTRLLHPEVVHVVPGRHALAGTFHGPAEVLATLTGTVAATGGTLSTTVEGMHTNSAGQVIVTDRTTASRAGRTLDASGAILFTITEGRISRIEEFYANPPEIERFWS